MITLPQPPEWRARVTDVCHCAWLGASNFQLEHSWDPAGPTHCWTLVPASHSAWTRMSSCRGSGSRVSDVSQDLPTLISLLLDSIRACDLSPASRHPSRSPSPWSGLSHLNTLINLDCISLKWLFTAYHVPIVVTLQGALSQNNHYCRMKAGFWLGMHRPIP
jgi:hypothetical protein